MDHRKNPKEVATPRMILVSEFIGGRTNFISTEWSLENHRNYGEELATLIQKYIWLTLNIAIRRQTFHRDLQRKVKSPVVDL